MSVRFVPVPCLVVLGLLALSACASQDDTVGSTEPSVAATATDPACPAQSRCYDFTEDSQGWPEVSDDQHFAGHDVYLEGSYRVGAREPGSWSMAAPMQVTDLSPGYGVKLQVDATPGQAFPDDAAWGATCWTRDLGGGRIAGFGAYVQPHELTVGLYDDGSGAFEPLKTTRGDTITEAGKKSHLTLRCVQETESGSPVAQVSARVGGTTVAVSYDSSADHRHWSPAEGLGLVAAGQGADVFYDHVVVTAQQP